MLLGLQGCVFSTGPPPSANAWAALGSRATDMVVYEGRCPPRSCLRVAVLRPRCVEPLCARWEHGDSGRGGASEARRPTAIFRRLQAPGPTLPDSGPLGAARFAWIGG